MAFFFEEKNGKTTAIMPGVNFQTNCDVRHIANEPKKEVGRMGATGTWLPALRCRFRIRFRNSFRKNRVRTCPSVNAVSVYVVGGACSAAVARKAQQTGRRVSLAKEWAKLQASWLRQDGKQNSILYERINGNGELTETENVILRKLRSSYTILTDERNSYVLLQRTIEIRLRRN